MTKTGFRICLLNHGITGHPNTSFSQERILRNVCCTEAFCRSGTKNDVYSYVIEIIFTFILCHAKASVQQAPQKYLCWPGKFSPELFFSDQMWQTNEDFSSNLLTCWYKMNFWSINYKTHDSLLEYILSHLFETSPHGANSSL